MKEFNYLLDPNLIQTISLNKLNSARDGKLNISDPTNPFMFLLENSANITASNMQALEAVIRRMYPDLALTLQDLFPYFNQNEMNNLFSVPSEAVFLLYINKKDFTNYSKFKNGYYKGVIPKYSTITVSDKYIFTLLNNIDIKYYPKSNKLLTKYIFSNLSISDTVNDDIDNFIIKDANNNEWFLLMFPVKQLERFVFKDNVISTMTYKKTFNIKDYYNFISVKTNNPYTNEKIDVNIALDSYNVDPDVPTLILTVEKGKIILELPIVYTIKNSVSDVFYFELFTTKGQLTLPLSSYTNEEFVLTLPNDIIYDTFEEDEVFNINQISHFLKAKTNTYGGKNQTDFNYIKNKVINYTTGDNKLPITLDDIISKLKENGFEYKYTIDNIFKRYFLINRDIVDIKDDVYINANNYNETISLSRLNTYSNKIKFIDRENEDISAIVIEPYQIFEQVDGKIIPLTDAEMDNIEYLANNDIDAYNERNLFFNPYKYVLDYNDLLKARIYDMSSPSIKDTDTYYENPSVDLNITISNKTIVRDKNKYRIRYFIKPDKEFLSLDLDYVKAQIDVRLNSGNTIKYGSSLQQVNGSFFFEFIIPFDPYINDDDFIKIYSIYGNIGEAEVTNKSKCIFSIYSNDPAMSVKEPGDISYIADPDKVILIYNEESIWDFIKRLNSLFVNYSVEYTERKYEIYEKDVYLTYKENVYELDNDGLPKLYPNKDNTDFELKIVHKKGDIIKDDKGNPVVLHKKGEVKLNDKGEPVIDKTLGMIHLLNIFLIDDVYLRTSADNFKAYLLDYLKELRQILFTEIPILNKKMLENTELQYLSNYTLGKVILDYNHTYVTLDNFLKPILEIYISEYNTSFTLSEKVKDTVKNIIAFYLTKKSFKIKDLEQVINNYLGEEVLAVKVNLFNNKENLPIINYTEKSSRFVLSKKLEYNEYKQTVVSSDITIKIIKI